MDLERGRYARGGRKKVKAHRGMRGLRICLRGISEERGRQAPREKRGNR
jgi:hypothetical protein